MFKLNLEKAEEPQIKFPTSVDSQKNQESSRKTSTSALLTTQKSFTVWITTNYGKFLKRWNTKSLYPSPEESYASQEATARTRHGKMDWLQIGKGVHQDCILSPYLFNFYAEYVMWNAGLDESQAEIKISGRNINNQRYSDDTTLMTENEEELKSLSMKMKEETEKAGLKVNIQKTKIMASSPITSWQIDEEKNGSSDRLYFLGLQNHCR